MRAARLPPRNCHVHLLPRAPAVPPADLLSVRGLAAAAGNGISLIAFPWLVLQHNGSASDASIVAGAASLPLLLSTLIAGTAVDYLGGFG